VDHISTVEFFVIDLPLALLDLPLALLDLPLAFFHVPLALFDMPLALYHWQYGINQDPQRTYCTLYAVREKNQATQRTYCTLYEVRNPPQEPTVLSTQYGKYSLRLVNIN
jgi:hypothetical protein